MIIRNRRWNILQDTRRQGSKQRARYRELAIVNAYLWLCDDGELSFDDLLARVRWRYPVSCSGDAFAADLRRLFDLTPSERENQWFDIKEQAGKTAPIRPQYDRGRGDVDWTSYPGPMP